MRQFLLTLGLLMAAPAAAAPEIAANLESATLHLPLPDGYCAIDTARRDETEFFDAQADALQPLNRLLGVAVDCGQLDAFRSGKHQFDRYLEFMSTQRDGKPMQRPDTERAAYIHELAAHLPKLDTTGIAESAGRQSANGGIPTSIQRVGMVGQDEAAVYLGGVGTYNATVLAYVSALSLAGGWAVSTNFYRNYADDQTVAGLLAEAKGEARAVIAANASADAAAKPSGASGNPATPTDWSWLITVASSLALLIALAVSARRRRRR